MFRAGDEDVEDVALSFERIVMDMEARLEAMKNTDQEEDERLHERLHAVKIRMDGLRSRMRMQEQEKHQNELKKRQLERKVFFEIEALLLRV